MIFLHPSALLLLLLIPLLWLWMRKLPDASRKCLALKCAVFAAIVFAIADPWVRLRTHRLAVTVLMDTSASMPRQALERGQAMLRDLVRKDSGAELRLITFARNPYLHEVPQQADRVVIPQGMDPNQGNATNLASALQLALSTFPSEGARRILLISDGNENRGDALAEALQARERGVPIFSVPSGGTAPLPVEVESIAAPQEVFSGERFTISMALASAGDMAARIWITSQGRQVGETSATLRRGENNVDVQTQITKSGVDLLQVHISSDQARQVLLSQAVMVRRPRVLYVAGGGQPSAALLETLKQARVDVQLASAFPVGSSPENWGAVLLDNYPDHTLSSEESAALEKYVYDGGGLIFIAGDKNAKLAEQPRTPFEKILPVRALPPAEKPTAVVLVLDKSGSMSGEKIKMARQAAIASIRTLRRFDKIGVISFDESHNWVVPIGPATGVQEKSKLINEITPNGGTKIFPAVEAAYEALVREEATRKHIILLTDGVSTPGTAEDFPRLERDASAHHITISTIGVGNYINRDLLISLALKTNGKSHFVENPNSIPQIISGELRDLKDLAIQERPVRAIRVRPVEFTDGVNFSQAPDLLGFVQSEARSGSETILRVDRNKPLLVRWHYGLGRVIAFMSDARDRWAARWIHWASFETLWPQMVRNVAHRDRSIRASVRPGPGEGEITVSYDVLPDADGNLAKALGPPGEPPRIVVERAGEPRREISLQVTAPGHYEARVPASQSGLYRIVSGSSQIELPEAGFYREAAETTPQPINYSLLGEISRVTFGRVGPSLNDLLSQKGTLVRERQSLWAYFLVVALLLNLIEVALRKGVFERLTGWLRRRAPLGAHNQPA